MIAEQYLGCRSFRWRETMTWEKSKTTWKKFLDTKVRLRGLRLCARAQRAEGEVGVDSGEQFAKSQTGLEKFDSSTHRLRPTPNPRGSPLTEVRRVSAAGLQTYFSYQWA